MANPVNTTYHVGRLDKDARFFENKDGSKKVLFNVVCENDYKDKDGNYGAQLVPMEAFIRKDSKSNGVYDYLKKGMLIAVQGTVKSDVYEKDGQKQFRSYIQSQSIKLMASPRRKEENEQVEILEEVNEEDTPF